MLGYISFHPTYELESDRPFLINLSATHHAPHEQKKLPTKAIINGWGGSKKRSRLGSCQGSVINPEVEATIAL